MSMSVLFLEEPSAGFLKGQRVYPDRGNILMSPPDCARVRECSHYMIKILESTNDSVHGVVSK